MKIIRAILIATLFTFTLNGFALADTAPTLALDPVGGAITGVAGSTVGWGFTLTNLGSDFAVITSSDFLHFAIFRSHGAYRGWQLFYQSACAARR